MDENKKIETSTTPYKSDSAEEPKSNSPKTQKNNPLHGVKLKDILEKLVEIYGWKKLGQKIKIRCFNNDPSIKSSLKFLRRTQWARDEVEALYLITIDQE